MKKFEIGKTYTTRLISDSNCKIQFTITARTSSTITAVDDKGIEKKYRLSKKYSEYRNAETFLPWGNYSMCPMVSA